MTLLELIADGLAKDRAQYGLADALRTAAWGAIEELDATSAQFADACAELGLHRQGAMNRFNEAKAQLAAFSLT